MAVFQIWYLRIFHNDNQHKTSEKKEGIKFELFAIEVLETVSRTLLTVCFRQ